MTRRLIPTLAAALVLLAGVWRGPAHDPASCARRLHVAYTVADGATERLSAFQACVGGAR